MYSKPGIAKWKINRLTLADCHCLRVNQNFHFVIGPIKISNIAWNEMKCPVITLSESWLKRERKVKAHSVSVRHNFSSTKLRTSTKLNAECFLQLALLLMTDLCWWFMPSASGLWNCFPRKAIALHTCTCPMYVVQFARGLLQDIPHIHIHV